MMAATTSFSNEDLLCSQCSDIYCFPVLLKCGHNICRVCLKKFWELKGCQECPVCGKVSLTGRPPINLALKIAADNYRVQRTDGNREICFLHNEKLQIFCQNDEEPICFLCKKSKKHKVHECCPVEEAAQQKKREISKFLESLRKKLRMLKKTKEHWEETKSYIQTQAYENESLIREEFEKLHLFLQEEENTRLKALKQEEKIKTQVMCEKIDSVKNQIENLSSTIIDIETSLGAKDLSFLQGYKQTKKRLKCNIQDPECIRDILINSAKHLGLLKFGIWKKMVDIVKYVPVTMDPNTAQSNLKFSEELTSVQYSTKQLLPDNPERCTNRVCLLGDTGFTTGKHSWTVEVGKAKGWYIGVAQESVNRKSAVFLNPAEGFWVIGLCNADSFWAQTSPPTKLLLKTKPEKITVELDCDRGKVVFMNATDLTTIHTFKDKFREKIFPYFSPGICEEEKISSPLLISPLTIRVDVEQSHTATTSLRR
ncbi:zinc-binding protein A33-like [Mastacembelus armatus]|uniref:zinc-binding protein A33-like n=1 Tax=Mastacembelus armatus TaxID=205130 RepID=UPI000E463D9E|nr:zinc-binding protein A33-like [Mastacembelus armatus]